MAFRVSIIQREHCDKCKSNEGEMIELATTGRHYDQRNFIVVHERCLQRSIENAKKRMQEIKQPAGAA